MKHFGSFKEAAQWGQQELIDSLRDDYNHMCTTERYHYTDEDRSEMFAKIEDMMTVQTVLEHILWVLERQENVE